MEKTRTCNRCLVEKPIDRFTRSGKRKNGNQIRRYTCIDCLRDDGDYRYRNILQKYRLTKEDVERKFQEQEGRCQICGDPIENGKAGFAVDHDHACCPTDYTCGECIRGFLCVPCNQAIGMLRDSPEILLNAHRYLLEWSTNGTQQ
ncbi:MAG: endonuclease VII domain-containing protein [Actinobacteria bacterium]|nr:endonuclease VII domain-containing protein [Actinomycetota bacterium]